MVDQWVTRLESLLRAEIERRGFACEPHIMPTDPSYVGLTWAVQGPLPEGWKGEFYVSHRSRETGGWMQVFDCAEKQAAHFGFDLHTGRFLTQEGATP